MFVYGCYEFLCSANASDKFLDYVSGFAAGCCQKHTKLREVDLKKYESSLTS